MDEGKHTPTMRRALQLMSQWFDRRSVRAIQALEAGHRDDRLEWILWVAGAARDAVTAQALTWSEGFMVLKALRAAYVRRSEPGELGYAVSQAEEWVGQRTAQARRWRLENRHWVILTAGYALGAARLGYLTEDDVLTVVEKCRKALDRLDAEADSVAVPDGVPENVEGEQ